MLEWVGKAYCLPKREVFQWDLCLGPAYHILFHWPFYIHFCGRNKGIKFLCPTEYSRKCFKSYLQRTLAIQDEWISRSHSLHMVYRVDKEIWSNYHDLDNFKWKKYSLKFHFKYKSSKKNVLPWLSLPNLLWHIGGLGWMQPYIISQIILPCSRQLKNLTVVNFPPSRLYKTPSLKPWLEVKTHRI